MQDSDISSLTLPHVTYTSLCLYAPLICVIDLASHTVLWTNLWHRSIIYGIYGQR